MKKYVNYPDVPIVGISFKNAKVCVVPNQSMTLQTILRRFIKREALPAERQGIYYESDYDLEKLMEEDIVDRHEVLEEIKRDVQVKRKIVEESNNVVPPVATPAPTPDPAPLVAPPSTPPA